MKANTKIFGCIADPINHVKAPTLFTKIFQEQKVNAIMIPIKPIIKKDPILVKSLFVV